MTSRFYGEKRSRVSDDLQLETFISCILDYKVLIIRTAIDVSFADPTSSTHAGIWLEESNQWCISEGKLMFARAVPVSEALLLSCCKIV